MKIFKIAFLLVLTLCANKIMADDSFTIEEFTLDAGETKDVAIYITNSNTIYGFQFSLYLPDGVEIVQEDGEYDIFMSNSRLSWTVLGYYHENDKHYEIGGGGLRGLSPTSNTEFIFFTVTATDKISTGQQICSIRNQRMTVNNSVGDPVTIMVNAEGTNENCTLRVPVKIGSSGYCSFSWPRNLDFTGCDNFEYVFAGKSETEDIVKITSIDDNQVPAAIGVLVQGTPGAIVYPQTIDNVNAVSSIFIGTSDGTSTVANKGDAWALAVKNGKTGFYPCEAGVVIPQYKCYLPGSVSGKSFISIRREITTDKVVSDDAGIVDGINTLEGDASIGTYYDLQGRSISTPRRGVYIQEGKKVIVK